MVSTFLLKGNYDNKHLICPKCNKSLLTENTLMSHNLIDHKYSDPEFTLEHSGMHQTSYKLRSSLYECEDKECGQEIILIEEENGKLNPKNGPSYIFLEHEAYIYNRKVKYMSPSVDIIIVPDVLNDELKNILRSSFSLFWIDLDSCANKLRVLLESLADQLYFPVEFSLGNRIKKLQTSTNAVSVFAEKFEAIKWIGNNGSHSKIDVTLERIIEAYAILEYLLDKIFIKTDDKIDSIAKDINLKKGI